jgi:uncharacterized protein (TIGR03790 family)
MPTGLPAARLTLIIACATSALAFGAPAAAQTGANVLVVINSSSTASETIGRQYVARRGVPQENVCTIQVPAHESVSRDVYEAQIEQPIWRCIATRQSQDRILYFVLTKDVPIRVSGTGGRSGTNASVDSELTLLYRRRTDVLAGSLAPGARAPIVGFVPNPYFAGTSAVDAVEPFNHRTYDIYLVTRLDGYTVEDALALIERASTATVEGRFVLAERASSADRVVNAWLGTAAERITSHGLGDRVVVEKTGKAVTGASKVLGYYSWGSNDRAITTRSVDFEFQSGALAGMFVSTDARTFKEPPAAWRPGGDARGESSFAGSSDSLIGDLIRGGVTGVSGNVDEPYLDASIRPDILFPAYTSGRNLAEAFYAAMPYLSWQTIVVGDPLCAPFPHTPIATEQIDPPIDAATDLPAYFARRQLATMPPALSETAAAAFIRFQSRTLHNDVAGARQALEAVIAAEPRFIPARLELAGIYNRAGDRERAIEQYRATLSYSPNDPVALNNLAYALAVYKNVPEDALPFAERASSVARNGASVFGGTHLLTTVYAVGSYDPDSLAQNCLDTLAWVQHLLGRDIEAANTIRQVHALGARDPEMLWHAAIIYAAIDDVTHAAAELSAAVAADPTLANRDEIQKLRQQLNAVSKDAPH